MDFIDEVRTRSGRFAGRVEHLDTEEATKSSLVLPFIQMLGYEIFDPTEVVPEFTADVGTKKGEKVDYALVWNGKPVILIEVKKYGNNLDEEQMSQLLRYFTTVTDARFGILTDGITYRFFSDLDLPNVMDPKPFFEFNMLDFTEAQVEELKRFTKSAFEPSQVIEVARELKYTTEIKRVLAEDLASPSEDFVRFVIRRVYEGRVTPAVRDQFATLAKQAFGEFIKERVDTRLKSALEREEGAGAEPSDQEPAEEPEQGEEPAFTALELEASQIIKAIVRDVVDVRRIGLRSSKTYCSVVLHDTDLKKDYGRVCCRLRLRTKKLRLEFLDQGRVRERLPLSDLDDLYSHADGLRAALSA
ncbi:MAG: type I restriction endonuclease [Chloroflexota bacterium]|nr:type I restriction endonuclease [Chloroflexota bacterium]